jgi:3-hydroxypropanoate dehydrogenase
MNQSLPASALSQLFTDARTHHTWQEKQVTDEQIQALYDLVKWGPTSMNATPARFLFIKSRAEKEKLLPALSGSNVQQVQEAPLVVIVAQDESFYDHMPKLFPVFDAKSMFAANRELAQTTAFRNSSLQGAYLLLAARALGLDAGPMSGFDNAKVDEIFFKGTSWKSNFISTLGYGDHSKVYPRGPRLTFDEAAKIV